MPDRARDRLSGDTIPVSVGRGHPHLDPLPQAGEGAPERARTTIGAGHLPGDPGPARILVVDDEPTNIRLAEAILAPLGYELVTASDGEEALSVAARSNPDVILLDLMMPTMDGYEVLDRLRADTTLRQIPVVIVSALGDIESITRGIERGADDHMVKPFNAALLRARLAACIERKRFHDTEERQRREIEAERNRAEGLLRAIFPPEVIDELKATGRIAPRRHEAVAVFFLDVVGFTAYCDSASAEEVVEHLMEMTVHLERMADRHGLEQIKTTGDGFIATCGLLSKKENPVARCVEAGLEMMTVVSTLAPGWQLRVGIHIGAVMAGVVGSQRYLFDIWGDTVNTAARVEHHGADGAVNLSAEAMARIDGYRTESLGAVEAKGKGQIEIFRILA